MDWPEIPSTIGAPLGPVPVVMVDQLEDCLGLWYRTERRIELLNGMAPVQAWWTLWHEWTHAVLDDLSVTLESEQEEAVCNAIAAARVMEMQRAA